MKYLRFCILLLAFIFIHPTAIPQKAAVTKIITKSIVKEGVEETAEQAAKKMLKKAAANSMEHAVAKQMVKKISREKLIKLMKKEGVKSFMAWGQKNVGKRLLSKSVRRQTQKNLIKQSEIAYKNSILSFRKTGRYVSRTASRIMIRKKDQFITKANYIKALSHKSPNFKIGYEKDGNILRENMLKIMPERAQKAMIKKGNSNQAHHIIGNSTPLAASKLKKYGIDINNPMNGIFLPSNGHSGLKGTVHRGGHKQDYYDYVENLFSNCKSKEECYDVLDHIKSGLYKGEIKLYNTHKVNKIFTNSIKKAS